MRFYLFLVFFLIFISTYSQCYEIENRDIYLKVTLDRQNDSTLIVTRTLYNKTDNIIFISPFIGEISFRPWVVDSITVPVELGTIQIGVPYNDIIISLDSLLSHDTIVTYRKITFGNIILRNRLQLRFDYLNPSQFGEKIQKDIYNSFDVLYRGSDYLKLGLPKYEKYCDWIDIQYLSIPTN